MLRTASASMNCLYFFRNRNRGIKNVQGNVGSYNTNWQPAIKGY